MIQQYIKEWLHYLINYPKTYEFKSFSVIHSSWKKKNTDLKNLKQIKEAQNLTKIRLHS